MYVGDDESSQAILPHAISFQPNRGSTPTRPPVLKGEEWDYRGECSWIPASISWARETTSSRAT